ncbi:hypothetical protein [Streptomyces sp. NPDC003688]
MTLALPPSVRARPRADLSVYRWSEHSLTGRNGVGPVATSLNRDDLHLWDGRVAPFVWAVTGSGNAGTSELDSGFLYLRFGAEAAMIRKRPVRDARGRAGSTLTHVLTAPADWLDLGLALALCRSEWDEWLPAGALQDGGRSELPTVPLDKLRQHLTGAVAELASAADTVPARLLAPVAQAVMATPKSPVTVIGSPVPPVEVVRVLHDVLAPLVAGEWTFATREESDRGTGLPRFVFLEEPEQGSLYGQSDRVTVMMNAEPDDPEALARAEQLIEYHRRRGPDAVRRLLPDGPLATAEDVREWQRHHYIAPGVIADVTSLLHDAVARDIDPHAAEFLARPASRPTIELHLRRAPLPELETLVEAWAPHRGDLDAYGPVRTALHTEALRRALRVSDGWSPEARSELLARLKRARPDAGLVVDAVRGALGAVGGRGESLDVLHVLMVARAVGISGREFDEVRNDAVERLATHQLITAVDRISALDPLLGRELLVHCARRRDRRDDRIQTCRTLRQWGYLGRAVRLMAVGGFRDAVDLYCLLITCAVGSGPGRTGVVTVLADAGQRPDAALLMALSRLARGRMARYEVLTAIENAYFRDQLSSRKYGGEHQE